MRPGAWRIRGTCGSWPCCIVGAGEGEQGSGDGVGHRPQDDRLVHVKGKAVLAGARGIGAWATVRADSVAANSGNIVRYHVQLQVEGCYLVLQPLPPAGSTRPARTPRSPSRRVPIDAGIIRRSGDHPAGRFAQPRPPAPVLSRSPACPGCRRWRFGWSTACCPWPPRCARRTAPVQTA